MKKEFNMKTIMRDYENLSWKYNGLWSNIPVEHYAKLEEWINEAQKKCTARTISVQDMCCRLAQFEKEIRITKKALEGTIVWVDDNAQTFPSAYRYTPYNTIFKAEMRKGSWRIVSIERDITQRHIFQTVLSESTKVALIERFLEFD